MNRLRILESILVHIYGIELVCYPFWIISLYRLLSAMKKDFIWSNSHSNLKYSRSSSYKIHSLNHLSYLCDSSVIFDYFFVNIIIPAEKRFTHWFSLTQCFFYSVILIRRSTIYKLLIYSDYINHYQSPIGIFPNPNERIGEYNQN